MCTYEYTEEWTEMLNDRLLIKNKRMTEIKRNTSVSF